MKLEERVKKAAEEIEAICNKYNVELAPLYNEGVGVVLIGEEPHQGGGTKHLEIEIMT